MVQRYDLSRLDPFFCFCLCFGSFRLLEIFWVALFRVGYALSGDRSIRAIEYDTWVVRGVYVLTRYDMGAGQLHYGHAGSINKLKLYPKLMKACVVDKLHALA